jgi:hypothetical protein
MGWAAASLVSMLMLILTWIGAVLGVAVLLVMALGPVIVEVDARLYERRHARRRAPAQERLR